MMLAAVSPRGGPADGRPLNPAIERRTGSRTSHEKPLGHDIRGINALNVIENVLGEYQPRLQQADKPARVGILLPHSTLSHGPGTEVMCILHQHAALFHRAQFLS